MRKMCGIIVVALYKIVVIPGSLNVCKTFFSVANEIMANFYPYQGQIKY